MLGFLEELKGESKLFDECTKVIRGWELTADEEEKKKELSADKKLGGDTKATFQQVLGYLGVAIDTVCNFKEKIIAFLTKNYRKYQRLYLQEKKNSIKLYKNIWGEIKIRLVILQMQ